MKNICQSCGSDRCGNHAGCARRKVQQDQRHRLWKAEWESSWAAILGLYYLTAKRGPCNRPNLYELREIANLTPLVYIFFEEYAWKLLRSKTESAVLTAALRLDC